MSTLHPAPSPTYIGPPDKSSSGSNKPINVITIHSTVSPTVRGGARSIAKYFQSASAGGSAHYVIDPYEVIQSAYDSVICWHAPPNGNSLGLEMCDMPDAKSKARWKDNAHRLLLRRTARLTAELCLAYGVPVKFLTPADLRAGRRGITTHANKSEAFHQSTHWDPGMWPQWWFMVLVRRYRWQIATARKKAAKKGK